MADDKAEASGMFEKPEEITEVNAEDKGKEADDANNKSCEDLEHSKENDQMDKKDIKEELTEVNVEEKGKEAEDANNKSCEDLEHSKEDDKMDEDDIKEDLNQKKVVNKVYFAKNKNLIKKLRKEHPLHLITYKDKINALKKSRADRNVCVYNLQPEVVFNVCKPAIMKLLTDRGGAKAFFKTRMDEKGDQVMQVMISIFARTEEEVPEIKKILKEELGQDVKMCVRSEPGYDDLYTEWNRGTTHKEKVTYVIPSLKEQVTAEDLWQSFPAASDIVIVQGQKLRWVALDFECHEAAKKSVIFANNLEGCKPEMTNLLLINLRNLLPDDTEPPRGMRRQQAMSDTGNPAVRRDNFAAIVKKPLNRKQSSQGPGPDRFRGNFRKSLLPTPREHQPAAMERKPTPLMPPGDGGWNQKCQRTWDHGQKKILLPTPRENQTAAIERDPPSLMPPGDVGRNQKRSWEHGQKSLLPTPRVHQPAATGWDPPSLMPASTMQRKRTWEQSREWERGVAGQDPQNKGMKRRESERMIRDMYSSPTSQAYVQETHVYSYTTRDVPLESTFHRDVREDPYDQETERINPDRYIAPKQRRAYNSSPQSYSRSFDSPADYTPEPLLRGGSRSDQYRQEPSPMSSRRDLMEGLYSAPADRIEGQEKKERVLTPLEIISQIVQASKELKSLGEESEVPPTGEFSRGNFY